MIKDRSHQTHLVRFTSALAYGKVEDLGEMQRLVYDCIRLNPCLTDREIALKLCLRDPNGVRPRRFELMEAGLIQEAPKRVCSVSGRLALTWKTKQ
jgi:hypothetical protein